MTTTCLEHILSTSTPFDDLFDSEALFQDIRVEHLSIWTNCGRRLDLEARSLGRRLLSLREVVDDAQANWNGCDDGAWETSSDLP